MAPDTKKTQEEVLAIAARLQDEADDVVLSIFEDRRRAGLELADVEINMFRRFLRNRLRKYITQAMFETYSLDRYVEIPSDPPPPKRNVLPTVYNPGAHDWPSTETMTGKPAETEAQKKITVRPPKR